MVLQNSMHIMRSMRSTQALHDVLIAACEEPLADVIVLSCLVLAMWQACRFVTMGLDAEAGR